MFLKTLDEKQKFNLKNLKFILNIGWHSDLHGKMNPNLVKYQGTHEGCHHTRNVPLFFK